MFNIYVGFVSQLCQLFLALDNSSSRSLKGGVQRLDKMYLYDRVGLNELPESNIFLIFAAENSFWFVYSTFKSL